jgi:hypothetical protein
MNNVRFDHIDENYVSDEALTQICILRDHYMLMDSQVSKISIEEKIDTDGMECSERLEVLERVATVNRLVVLARTELERSMMYALKALYIIGEE